MSDQGNRFLKDDERISTKPYNKKKRIFPLAFVLLDIILIILIYTLVAKPALEKIEVKSDSVLMINDFEIEFNIIDTHDEYIVDLFIRNNGTKTKTFACSNIAVTPSFIDEKYYSVLSVLELEPGKARHCPIYIPKAGIKSFYLTFFYENKEIYQTKILNPEK